MDLSKEEYNKLVENIRQIFDYLEKEIVPNIIDDVNICNILIYKNKDSLLDIIIHSAKKPYFSIIKKNGTSYSQIKYYYIIDNNTDKFKVSPERLWYDLLNDNEIMYAILDNWNIIKNKCLDQVNNDKEVKDRINNFQI